MINDVATTKARHERATAELADMRGFVSTAEFPSLDIPTQNLLNVNVAVLSNLVEVLSLRLNRFAELEDAAEFSQASPEVEAE